MSYEDECPICGIPNASEVPSSMIQRNAVSIRGSWKSDQWRTVCGKCADERMRFHFGDGVTT